MVFLWIYFPIVVLGSYIIKNKWRNLFLLIASLFFYAWGEPIYVFLMMFSIVFNWFFGLLIEKYKKYKKTMIAICIIGNIIILGYFKYYNFLVSSLNKVIGKDHLIIKINRMH